MSLVREMAMVSVRVTAIWLAALWWLCGAAVAGPLEIRVTLQLPPGSPLYESIANFKAEVEKQTRGAIAVTIHPTAQLYKPSEVRGAVSSGAIEMGASVLSEYLPVVPASDIFSLPFMFTSQALLRGATAPGSPIRSPIDEACVDGPGFARVGAAIFDANIACGHVSGLLMRQAYAAGPRWVSLVDRSQTIQWHRCAVASAGVSDPGRNRSPSSASLQIVRYFGFLRHRHAPAGLLAACRQAGAPR
jgi:hypothetical protein